MRPMSRRSLRTSSPVRRRVFRPLLSRLEDRTLLATVTWINPAGGDWDTPSNWSSDAVPGPSDVVVIDLGGVTVTHSSSASDAVNSLTIPVSGVTLNLSNGSLALSADSDIAGSLTMSGGTLSTTGTLTVTGTMDWTGGTILGGGTLSIPAGATLTLGDPSAADTETLDGVALDNAGALTLYAGALDLDSGALVDNLAGGTFIVAGSMSIQGDGAPGEAFTNEGALVYDPADSGYSPINLVFDQTGTGSTDVDAGTLALGVGGTVDGTMTVDANATMGLGGAGAFELDSTSSVQGAGTVAVAGPTVTVDGVYNISGSAFVGAPGTSMRFNSDTQIENLGSSVTVYAPLTLNTNQSFTIADLQVLSGYGQPMLQGGGGDLTVTSSMTWTGGTISGFSTLTISSQPTLNLSPGYGGTSTLDGIALDNEGAATLTGGVIGSAGGGTFNNEPGANFDFNIPPGGACCYTGFQDINLNNYGTTNWTSGNLAYGGNGIFNNKPGATFNADADGGMVGDTFNNLVGATFALANDAGVGTQMALVFNNTGTVNLGSTGAAGLLTINGNYTQTSTGSLDFDLGGTTADSQYNQLAVSGTATLGGTVDVSVTNGSPPALGNTFQPLIFSSSTGAFGFYNGIILGHRLILDPALNPTNLTLTVQPAVTTTTLAALPSPSVSGQYVTVTAAVTVALPPTTIDRYRREL